jgi:hypothetical protein
VVEKAANRFIFHDADLFRMCTTLGISVDFLVSKMVTFTAEHVHELTAERERFKTWLETEIKAGEELLDIYEKQKPPKESAELANVWFTLNAHRDMLKRIKGETKDG